MSQGQRPSIRELDRNAVLLDPVALQNQNKEEVPVVKHYTPLLDLVCLVMLKMPDKDGSIILPDSAKGKSQSLVFRVIAVGSLVKELKEGDVVICSNTTPCARMRHLGMDTMVTREEFIAGKLDKKFADKFEQMTAAEMKDDIS